MARYFVRTTDRRSRTVRLVPQAFIISPINSFEGNFVRTPPLLRYQFQAAACWYSRWLASITERIDLGCTSNLMRVLIFLTAPP